MKAVESEGRSSERAGGFVGVDLDETDGGVSTGGEGTLPDDSVREGLRNGCFESWDGLFVEGCSHAGSGRGRM